MKVSSLVLAKPHKLQRQSLIYQRLLHWATSLFHLT